MTTMVYCCYSLTLDKAPELKICSRLAQVSINYIFQNRFIPGLRSFTCQLEPSRVSFGVPRNPPRTNGNDKT